MRNMISKVALAVAGLVGVVSSAQAGFSVLTLRWGPGSDFITCDTSNFAACAASVSGTGSSGAFSTVTVLGNESLRFVGTLGGTTAANSFFSIDTNVQTNAPGTPLLGQGLAASTAITRQGAATGVNAQLTVDFVSYGFTNPAGVDKLLFGTATQNTTGSAGLGGGDAVNTIFSVDSINTGSFVSATDLTTCNLIAGSSTQCTAPTVAWTDAVAGYSLRAQQSYFLAAGSFWNASAGISVRNVPEPMTAALVGIALLGMAATARRRNSKKA